MIIDPAFTNNSSFNNEGILASCQSFFVRAKGTGYIGAGNVAGNLKFSNRMRSTALNTTFAKIANTTLSNPSLLSDEGKIWLNLSDSQGYTVQQGVSFLNDNQDEYVVNEDINNISGRKYNFYSQIDTKDLIINIMGAFDTNKIIPLGISNISNNPSTAFSISIPKKEGVFDTQTIYLFDSLLNVTHNLSAAPYTFTSSDMVIEGRFYLQFTNTSTTLAKQSKQDVVVYCKDGVINISSEHQNIVEVVVTDLYDVKKGIKTIAEVKHQKTKFIQLLADDSLKLVEVTITLEDGTIIHKKVCR